MSNNTKRHWKIILGVGLLYGVLLVLARYFLDLSDQETWQLYILLSTVLLAGVLMFNLIWQLLFMKKMKQAMAILNEQNDLDGFLRATEDLQEKTRFHQYKQLLNINLSYGYAKKEDYSRAKEILKNTDSSRLKKINLAIYYLNLANFSFLLNEQEEGATLMQEHAALLKKYENHAAIGSSLWLNRLYERLAMNDPKGAEELLPQAEKHCVEPEQQKELAEVKEKIEVALSRAMELMDLTPPLFTEE